MFHPLSPAPCYVYFWPALQAIEAIYHAIGQAVPEAVPAWSGGCNCSLVWWGVREGTGEPWGDGSPHPIGQGAHARGDGAHSLMVYAQSATRFTPIEIWEARNPWLVEQFELAPNSGGAGKFQGGLGVDISFLMLEDCRTTPVVERSKSFPWGLNGGQEGRSNLCSIRYADGARKVANKVTGIQVPKGAALELHTGGGGGWGPPAARDPQAVCDDIREGYITEDWAQRHYPHAVKRVGFESEQSKR
jgi:N-methylhydantoinase B